MKNFGIYLSIIILYFLLTFLGRHFITTSDYLSKDYPSEMHHFSEFFTNSILFFQMSNLLFLAVYYFFQCADMLF